MTSKTSLLARLRNLGKMSKAISTGTRGNKPVGVSAKVQDKPPAPGSFRAVEVKPGAPCCMAAQAEVGIRHLTREKPPKLPLEQCTLMDRCDCRFQHHEDRRAGPRRRGWAVIETKMGHELLLQQKPAHQIRRSRGRRKDD